MLEKGLADCLVVKMRSDRTSSVSGEEMSQSREVARPGSARTGPLRWSTTRPRGQMAARLPGSYLW